MSNIDSQIRFERAAMMVGQVQGQLAELLNNMKNTPMGKDAVYHSILDITKMAALQVHEIYYKGNKPEQLWVRADERLPTVSKRYAVIHGDKLNAMNDDELGYSTFYAETKEFAHTNILWWFDLGDLPFVPDDFVVPQEGD